MMIVVLESGFVGREREYAALSAALAREPALVLVEGEAGIGKTRLLREVLISRNDDRRANLLAGCPPFRTPHTLAPIVDAVRASTERVGHLALSPLAGALRPLFPEWSEELPSTPEPLEDIRAAQYRLFRALLELLRRMNVHVLAVEDLHWADDATVEFLLFLTNQHPYPLSVVGTFRPGDVPSDSLLPRLSTRHNAARIEMRPLDLAATAKLVSTMLGGETVSTAFAAFLHERTSGIPLLAEESVRLLHDRGELVRRDGGWMRRHISTLVVPPTVRDAVLERARHLDPPGRAVLEAAAVLNHPVDEATLTAVASLPPDEIRAGLGQGLGSGLLRENEHGRVVFCHALAALAVHEAIPGPHRRDLHRMAAHLLTETDVAPVRLAHHYRNASNTTEWCRHAERAAGAALTAADETTAATLLYDVVTGVDLPADVLARLVGKIPAGTLTGSDRCATLQQILLAALDHDLAPSDDAELRLQLSRLLLLSYDEEACHRELARAVEHLGHDPAKAAYAMARLGHLGDRTSPVGYHLDWLARAGELAESLDPVQRTTITVSRMEGLLALGESAGWDLAARITEIPSATQTRETTLRAQINLADACATWGHYSEARRRLALARDLVDADVYPGVHALIAANQVGLDLDTGHWDGLATRADALRHNGDLPSVSGFGMVCVIGMLHAAAGMADRADEELTQALSGLRYRRVDGYSCNPKAPAVQQPDKFAQDCAMCRQGNALSPRVNLGHGNVSDTGILDPSTTHLYLGDKEIPQTRVDPGYPAYMLPPERHSYRLVTDYDNTGYGHTHADWTFTSAAPDHNQEPPGILCRGEAGKPCEAQPLVFLTYDMNVDLHNAITAPGVPQFTVTADHQAADAPAIRDVKLWTSTDDGQHWKPALLLPRGRGEHGSRTFSVITGVPWPSQTTGALSIKAQATDADGNSITQTLTQAVKLTQRTGWGWGWPGHRIWQ